MLDLCLECRACKAECPVGVDMARFKSEFLADYWQRHGTPLHARVLGNARTLAALGQPVRAAVELGRSERAGRRAQRARGSASTAAARLPRVSRRPLDRARTAAPAAAPTAVLFADTFTTTTTRRSAWPRST